MNKKELTQANWEKLTQMNLEQFTQATTPLHHKWERERGFVPLRETRKRRNLVLVLNTVYSTRVRAHGTILLNNNTCCLVQLLRRHYSFPHPSFLDHTHTHQILTTGRSRRLRQTDVWGKSYCIIYTPQPTGLTSAWMPSTQGTPLIGEDNRC